MPPASDEIDPVRLYLPSEVAAILKVSKRTIINWIHCGAISASKINGYFRIPGTEIRRLLTGTQRTGTYLGYNGFKSPWASYMMYLLIETGGNEPAILDKGRKYRLVPPTSGEIQELWAALKKAAPAVIRRCLDRSTPGVLTLGNPKFKDWVARLGIMGFYEHPVLPCQGILEDASEKRQHIEVMLCGRVPYQDIVTVMAAKYGYALTEDVLDFFARHFFNVYNFSSEDITAYLGRVQSRTEAFHKRRAWGDPDRAKATLEIPRRVDFDVVLNEIAAMSMLRFKDLLAQGPLVAEQAKEMAMLVVRVSGELRKRDELRAEREQAAALMAQRDDPAIKIEVRPEEPPCYEDLDQPTVLPAAANDSPAPLPETKVS
jgi:hypothetical protein